LLNFGAVSENWRVFVAHLKLTYCGTRKILFSSLTIFHMTKPVVILNWCFTPLLLTLTHQFLETNADLRSKNRCLFDGDEIHSFISLRGNRPGLSWLVQAMCHFPGGGEIACPQSANGMLSCAFLTG